MLARNAAAYGNQTALVELKPSENQRYEITWQTFDQRANRIAHALMQRGIGKGDRVIHLMMNSINWLEVYFGIIRTGAWAVPLNFRFSSQDIQYCADISEARAIFFGEEFTERVAAIRPQLKTIKDFVFTGQNLPADTESLEDFIVGSSAKLNRSWTTLTLLKKPAALVSRR